MASAKSKYYVIPKDDLDNFLNYLNATLRQVIDLRRYIFKIYPSIDEASLEENEYTFLRIPNLDALDDDDLLSEIWKILEKYSHLFEEMQKQWQNYDVYYHNQLKYTLQNSRVLHEHVFSWLRKTPQPVDDVPRDIWTFNKSNSLIRDLTIFKTYIKHLNLISSILNKMNCVYLFNKEEFISSNSI